MHRLRPEVRYMFSRREQSVGVLDADKLGLKTDSKIVYKHILHSLAES